MTSQDQADTTGAMPAPRSSRSTRKKNETPRVGPQRDREATIEVLAQAVLRILDRSSILAGFSLTAVADEAQVDKGLVYRYFGDRQGLLRNALRRGSVSRYAGFDHDPTVKPISQRWSGYLRTMISYARPVRLVTLLHLDGDHHLRLLPLKDQSLREIEEARAAGLFRENISGEAFIALVSALGYGYSLLRERLADELGRDLVGLDGEVDRLFNDFLSVTNT